jgi:hypothetical protein
MTGGAGSFQNDAAQRFAISFESGGIDYAAAQCALA